MVVTMAYALLQGITSGGTTKDPCAASTPDRVGYWGLRPSTLPHHRTYRFRYPAVEVTPVRQSLMGPGSDSDAASHCRGLCA